jgi:hypothetical protein
MYFLFWVRNDLKYVKNVPKSDRKSQKSKEITTLDLKKLKGGQKFKFFAIMFLLP